VAIVVFLRGVNVGGHRRFRPAALAKQLDRYGVINVGATGLFVVLNPGPLREFRAELARRLPFETELAICEGREILALAGNEFFGEEAFAPDVIPFVSVLCSKTKTHLPKLPLGIPSKDDWYVRILGQNGRFVFGIYRRHMKTIGYLGKIDKALRVPVTTRNWNTIAAVMKVLKK